MNVPHWHIGTGTLEEHYLSLHTYDSAYMMHSCVIYLLRHHNFVSRQHKDKAHDICL